MQAPYPSGEIVEKPWGTEKWIDCNDHYAVRELLIRKGHAVSLQYHEKKLETLYVLQGRAIYTTQDEQGRFVEREVGPGDIMKTIRLSCIANGRWRTSGSSRLRPRNWTISSGWRMTITAAATRYNAGRGEEGSKRWRSDTTTRRRVPSPASCMR